jgi:hypothetical protein
MEIKYIETKALYIHHVYKVTEEEMAKECLGHYSGHRELYWGNGIMFLFEQILPIMENRISIDYMEGKEHWQDVYYTEMPSYKEYVELEGGDFRGAKVRVINSENFSPHSEFTKWIKTFKK